MEERKQHEELTTLEFQDMIYKLLAAQIHRTKGLSRSDLIKRANKPTKVKSRKVIVA